MFGKNVGRLFSLITKLQTFSRNINLGSCKEVSFKVPWGQVAGLWWGPRDRPPLLALHGWQDNAHSWTPLVQHLPHHSVLALDFPGSGLSSHLPPFHNYYLPDNLSLIRQIKSHLGLEKLFLLGHSDGSATAFLYSSIFPEDVSAFFGVDYLLNADSNHKKRASEIGKLLDKVIDLGLRDPRNNRQYSWEEAKEAWVTGTEGSVSPVSAELLMQRGVRRLGEGKVVFSRDQRMKSGTPDLATAEEMEAVAGSVRCHILLIKASNSTMFDQDLKGCPQALDILRKGAASFELHTLPGGHHLHMDSPQTLVPFLIRLLEKVNF